MGDAIIFEIPKKPKKRPYWLIPLMVLAAVVVFAAWFNGVFAQKPGAQMKALYPEGNYLSGYSDRVFYLYYIKEDAGVSPVAFVRRAGRYVRADASAGYLVRGRTLYYFGSAVSPAAQNTVLIGPNNFATLPRTTLIDGQFYHCFVLDNFASRAGAYRVGTRQAQGALSPRAGLESGVFSAPELGLDGWTADGLTQADPTLIPALSRLWDKALAGGTLTGTGSATGSVLTVLCPDTDYLFIHSGKEISQYRAELRYAFAFGPDGSGVLTRTDTAPLTYDPPPQDPVSRFAFVDDGGALLARLQALGGQREQSHGL